MGAHDRPPSGAAGATPVIRIGRETFAAGLFWQPVPTVAVAAREARIVASREEIGADLFCVRRQGVPQFALGQTRSGHRPGMRSIAAALANGVGQSDWTGAFPVEGVWLFVMVRKGAIMPDGDLLFADEAAARAHMDQELGANAGQQLFAPTAWCLAGSRSETLPDLLSRARDARLRPVVRRTRIPLVVVTALLAGGAGLWVASEQRTPAVPDVPVQPPPPPPPWHDQPVAASVIRACEAAVGQVGFLPGYDLEQVTCGPGGLSAAYRRRSGSVDWLPRASLVTAPDRAAVVSPAPKGLVQRGPGEAPVSYDLLRRRVWGAAETYRLDAEMVEQPMPPSQRAGQAPEVPSWRIVSVTLGGRLSPRLLSNLLEGLPTLVMDEVAWTPSGWRVKGKVYVR